MLSAGTRPSLDAWFQIARKALWESLADVRKTFGSADSVGKWTIFQIKGNKYRLAELLTVLIEDFEEEAYPVKAARPVEVVRELMDANGLKQKDLLDVFCTASIASEVLREKRSLTVEHIRKLSRRFHVSPEIFF